MVFGNTGQKKGLVRSLIFHARASYSIHTKSKAFFFSFFLVSVESESFDEEEKERRKEKLPLKVLTSLPLPLLSPLQSGRPFRNVVSRVSSFFPFPSPRNARRHIERASSIRFFFFVYFHPSYPSPFRISQ